MSRSLRIRSHSLVGLIVLAFVGLSLSPEPALPPQAGGPWILFGTVGTGDGTNPDWPQAGNVVFIAYPGGGLVYLDGPITAGGSYRTTRSIGTGGYGNGTAFASGYFNAYSTYGPISGDTGVNFTIIARPLG